MRLIHLSDLHFGRHDDDVVHSLEAEISSQRPDLVVVSGDFTQIGSEEEFAKAREFLDTLPAPYLAVPGNHDVPERNLWRRFFSPYSYYKRYICSDLEPFLHKDGIAIAGLKTSRRANLRGLNWSDGSISSEQLEKLERGLSGLPPQTVKIVVAHHPLMHPEEEMVKHQNRVRRADRALQTFARLGVRLVLSGHFHMSYVRRHEHPGSIRSAEPTGPRESASGHILVAQAASTTSTRLRGEPNAYNLIDIANGEIAISVREWLGEDWRTRERAREAA